MSDYYESESDNGAVMHWFGKQDLGIKFGICLGILIVLVVLLGCCKLIYNKHKLKKHTKAAEVNKSEAKEELHVLNRREEEEGDLFGIRALEKGFYGGVAQSRPATPISTQSTLVPPRSVHDPSRPSSDTGYLKNSHASGSGKDAVDMHLVVPPSPTFPRRNETRSPSPDGSSSSQGNAPQLEMPTIPSSGLSIQTYSNRPTSPRTQTSQFSSAGGHSDRGVPTVTISQSDSDRPQGF